MRKRIAIAIVAVLVVSVGVYLVSVFSGPKRGTVEWHKREYLDARMAGGKWIELAPGFVEQWYVGRQVERAEFHFHALVQRGYLTSREFSVSYATPVDVEAAVIPRVSRFGSNSWFVDVSRSESNTVKVTAPHGILKEVEELVRKADVPKAAE